MHIVITAILSIGEGEIIFRGTILNFCNHIIRSCSNNIFYIHNFIFIRETALLITKVRHDVLLFVYNQAYLKNSTA